MTTIACPGCRAQFYVARLREGAAADAAFDEAWRGVRWPDVQRAWRTHVDGLSPPR